MKRRPIVSLATHPRPYVTPPELAAFLSCDPRTILRMIKTGSLPAFRVGRTWRVTTEQARQAFPDRSTFHEEHTSNSI